MLILEKKPISIQISAIIQICKMEVRGLEPLTSGLQSPRSAKLSYTPNTT